jgi:hypothetical protein
MKYLTLTALLALLAVPAMAGSIGFAVGESCSVSADSVSCSAQAGRGSLVIEAGVPEFVKLQNALTTDWEDGVPVTCGDCLLGNGFPGCTTENDQVLVSRKQLALSRLVCRLRDIVVQADYKAAVDAAVAGLDENPDIGGGDPQ